VCAVATYLTYSRAGVIGAAIAFVLAVALSRHRWAVLAHALVAAAAAGFVILEIRAHEPIAEATGTEGRGAVLAALLVGALVCAGAAAATRTFGVDRRLRLSPAAARAGLAGLAVVVLVGLVVASPALSNAWDDFKEPPPASRSDDPAERLQSAGGIRYQIWDSALDAFAENPFNGMGSGTFEFWWSRTGGGESLRDAHSLYLEQLAELGLPGLLLALLALGGLVAVGLRQHVGLGRSRAAGAQAAALAALVVFAFHAGVDWMWENTAVAALAVLCGGVATTAGGVRRWTLPFLQRLPLVALAVGALVIQWPGLVATSKLRESQEAYRAGDPRHAAELADEAVDAAPWASSPYAQRGLVAESRGQLGRALRDLERARDREPTNWRHPLLIARVEAQRGRTRDALAAFREAKRLRRESAFLGIRPPAPPAPRDR
jgi:hypothetical protein